MYFNFDRNFLRKNGGFFARCFVYWSVLMFCVTTLFVSPAAAQGTTNGGFVGIVQDGAGTPIPDARITFTNQTNGFEVVTTSKSDGTYAKNTLPPGVYKIKVEVSGYQEKTISKELYTTKNNEVLPPIILEKVKEVVTTNPDPNPSPDPTPVVRDGGGQTDAAVTAAYADSNISRNPRRDGIFNEFAVRTLPLGGTTLTRTFDELAFLVPGVVLPPQAIGNSVGPGVGGGVGTSGQFSVNGLRSRANNFTVDGSDNNDEDIGVRRQGFFTLVPQPIESIQEFTIITLLAPAEFGRNFGAQVNVNSKSGGNRIRGSVFGLANADFLNARNTFDNVSGNSSSLLEGRRSDGSVVPVFVDGERKRVFNDAGRKDAFSLLQGGIALGGPIVRDKMFFFVSGEIQHLDGTKESHFVVPTVEERGFVRSGATGLQQCPVMEPCTVSFLPGFPTSVDGDAVFSLFPFPNDPTGIYGRNTYTQELSIDAVGRIFSGRYDWNIFKIRGNQQTFTARYNYTDDERDLTDVGGALFSAIRPLVRTDNISSFLSGSLSNAVSNELRFSFGRTRLDFEEIKDKTGFLKPVARQFNNPDDARFLLNAPLLYNNTFPVNCSVTGCFAPLTANYANSGINTEDLIPIQSGSLSGGLGLIGQLKVAGFSPVGVDVFNFPQERTNNTFQIADTMRWQINSHNISFGTDIRRVYLESDLPRNSRPLVTFNGAPDLFDLCRVVPCENQGSIQDSCIGIFCTGADLASSGAATGFFQSLVLPGQNAQINLRYNQFDFFAQDEWRLHSRVLLSFGLRYEFNTTPEEADGKIENTFSQSLPPVVASLSTFIDGRSKIYDSDRNNFAPRVGISAAITDSTVLRAGFGIYYDQILGAVVSQSRNVFPTFTTLNFGGGLPSVEDGNVVLSFNLFNPLNTLLFNQPIIRGGTLNVLNVDQTALLNAINFAFPFFNFDQNGTTRIAGSAVGATLPQKTLNTPFAYHYTAGLEQELFDNTFINVAYVGTRGRDLLRFTTPNLGSNYLAGIRRVDLVDGQPQFEGVTFDPTGNPANNLFAGRPVPLIGPINRFESTGKSRYDSLQVGVRGRMTRNFQYRVSYVFGEVKDDVSDVFDLAGAYALPQNSITEAGEYAPANFDVKHRFTYSFIYNLPDFDGNKFFHYVLGDWQIVGTGRFSTGQPFTVNSIFDVNLDGNLTDRLNNTRFITVTGDRAQPLRLTSTSAADLQSMLAALGTDGSVERNSFRAGNILDLDMSFARNFRTRETQSLEVRFDVFNFINRANFGVPVRILEFPGFGQATDTVTPGRRIQLRLRYNF